MARIVPNYSTFQKHNPFFFCRLWDPAGDHLTLARGVEGVEARPNVVIEILSRSAVACFRAFLNRIKDQVTFDYHRLAFPSGG